VGAGQLVGIKLKGQAVISVTAKSQAEIIGIKTGWLLTSVAGNKVPRDPNTPLAQITKEAATALAAARKRNQKYRLTFRVPRPRQPDVLCADLDELIAQGEAEVATLKLSRMLSPLSALIDKAEKQVQSCSTAAQSLSPDVLAHIITLATMQDATMRRYRLLRRVCKQWNISVTTVVREQLDGVEATLNSQEALDLQARWQHVSKQFNTCFEVFKIADMKCLLCLRRPPALISHLVGAVVSLATGKMIPKALRNETDFHSLMSLCFPQNDSERTPKAAAKKETKERPRPWQAQQKSKPVLRQPPTANEVLAALHSLADVLPAADSKLWDYPCAVFEGKISEIADRVSEQNMARCGGNIGVGIYQLLRCAYDARRFFDAEPFMAALREAEHREPMLRTFMAACQQ